MQIPKTFLRSAMGDSPDVTLDLVGGTYDCPKRPDGTRIGKLVGYAGKYEDSRGAMKQKVGDYYADFAYAEQYPEIYAIWAQRMRELCDLDEYCINVVLGAPMGGLAVAQALACEMSCRYVYPEKVQVAAGIGQERGEEKFVFNRHFINPGERVAIGEDVTNNFSTTGQLIKLVKDSGGQVVVICSWWNRSAQTSYADQDTNHGALSVESLLHRQMAQYQQDDAAVVTDILAGNVAWKPKAEFRTLRATYEEYRKK
ncbi:MAG: hypothetical protein ABI643_01040 [Candidatus Doudnabacteria bacterium]